MAAVRGHRIFLIASLAGALCACSGLPGGTPSSAQTVELDGIAYTVEELTASTWTALAPQSMADGPKKTAGLVRAIEKASRCKVTDSSYGARSAALNAQVDCGGKLKN